MVCRRITHAVPVASLAVVCTRDNDDDEDEPTSPESVVGVEEPAGLLVAGVPFGRSASFSIAVASISSSVNGEVLSL